jgi:hypothetical protein
MAASKNSRTLRPFEPLLALLALALLSLLAVNWFHRQGYLLYFGDAAAHMNIARRVLDSRTPGYRQIGTVWLPLPHVLMLPFIGNDTLWRSGLAGAIPSAVCFVLAGAFLFAATRRALESTTAASVAVAVFALNPNLLYLQSTAMTEPVLFAALAALLYATVRFRQTQSAGAVLAAAGASLAASLARYEGWSLIPFVALYFLLASRRRRFLNAFLFAAVAALAPLYWLGHNWWNYGNALEFYNGPYSALAIYQRALDAGMTRYPGDHDWPKAWLYFCSAARLSAGAPLALVGLAGLAAAWWKRAWWPVILLGLPPIFYVLSVHSSGTPIFVPHLWPNTYYNTRYGLAALPLLAFGAAALVLLAPVRFRAAAAFAVVLVAVAPWLADPRPAAWISWREAEVNSEPRRAWTREAALFLRANYRPGAGIITAFADLSGVFQEAGIPFREVLHEDNQPQWDAAVGRPDLFLREEWALAISADKISTALARARRNGPNYECVKMIAVKGAPVIEIYRRRR